MKRRFVLLALALLSVFCVAGAQTFQDYVSSMKGDTAVVKDYWDRSEEATTLGQALNLDATPPAGRVYMLKTAGYYPILTTPTSSADRPVVIVGENFTPLVQNKDAAAAPPIICGFRNTGGNNTGGFNIGSDLTVKNCAIIPGISDGTLGWAFFGTTAANQKLVLENDLFERTRWVEIQSNSWPGLKLYILNSYFVNLSGQPCRRNGGVYDNVNNNTDTIWVENTTHVMAQGSMYKFRNYQINKLFFNHNTFVDCAGSIFESQGYVSDLTVTNNIFVNCQAQAFGDSIGNNEDKGEVDPHWLPTGIVNLDTLDASMVQMDRKVLVDKNVFYNDPRFDDIVATLKANNVNGDQSWVSQMITMNTRTQAMFDNNAQYPFLTEGTWYKKLPAFTDPKDLLTNWVDSVKAFATKTVDIKGLGTAAVLSEWRKVNVKEPDNYIYSDWPIPENLAYSDADLLTGGTNGFPVGDLNWFPTQKASWDAQKDAEHAKLLYMLTNGTLGVKEGGSLPEAFALDQNYPNPFNPTTTITFSLPHASDVSLKVFNLLGQEVATLLNGNQAAGTHEVKFNAAGLSSGVYFYKLVSGDFTQVKKMSLVK